MLFLDIFMKCKESKYLAIKCWKKIILSRNLLKGKNVLKKNEFIFLDRYD